VVIINHTNNQNIRKKNFSESYLSGNLSGADVDKVRSEFAPSLFLFAVSTDGFCALLFFEGRPRGREAAGVSDEDDDDDFTVDDFLTTFLPMFGPLCFISLALHYATHKYSMIVLNENLYHA